MVAFAHNRVAAGVTLIGCAGCAAYGLATKTFTGLSRLWWLIPQQALLSVVVTAVVYAVVMEHYADAVPRSWKFILADQAPVLTLFYIHASGIIRRARDA